jgi:hypothetical protein
MHQAMNRARDRTPRILRDDMGDGQSGHPINRGRPPVPVWRVRKALRTPSLYVLTPSVTNSIGPHCAQAATMATNRPIRSRFRWALTAPPSHSRVLTIIAIAIHSTRLGFDVNLIGLHLHQIAWLHDLGVMDGFRVGSCGLHPFAYRLCREAVGHLNRRDRTAVADQGDDTGDRLLVGAPTREHRPPTCAERFLQTVHQ